MIDAEVLPALRHFFLIVSLLLPRMLTIFAIIPFFSKLLHGHVRNSLVFSLVVILYPMVAPTITIDPTFSLDLLVMIVKEIFIGTLLGFLFSIVFWAVESTGSFIDYQRGAGMASVYNPLSGHQDSPYGMLFLQAVAVLFFTTGGFLTMLSLLFESYKFWPIDAFFPHMSEQFPYFFLQYTDLLMEFALLYAAPIVIALFFVELGLGLINRFAPQLNVFFIAMPIKSGLAAAILILYFYSMSMVFQRDLLDMNQAIAFLQGVVVP
jgi:type III secretion protein T